MKAKNNRTITLSEEEKEKFLNCKDNSGIFCDNFFDFNDTLEDSIADLIVIDPPYNLSKKYSTTTFGQMTDDMYKQYMDEVISKCLRVLKPNGTMYVCGDWKTSFLQQEAISKYEKNGECFIINRITWARDKGKGSNKNWKNNIEDILMVVKDKNNYTFNADSVKIKKTVLATYKDQNGENKDWVSDESGCWRMTYASNIWNDITIPFWSMPENTNHPTQKPEKLYTKLVLASSNENDLVYEPFCGTGTGCVVSKKLGRKWLGVEKEQEYWMLAQKRLEMADIDKTIQGYEDGIFKDKK
jgi:site-specific DNA-methyltransferase (adenine-specific)